ncbi:MAG: valine--tRNA ligase [Mucilaginibacter polytrichastri]|nr:valine--tRNA ligase [Mucilaginibacter polytrichastri]
MSLAKTYDPKSVEEKWYQYWLDQGFFHSEPDEREPYTIVIPPPNVTGVLHMGHMLNNTIQDVLVRRARMMGKNACWVPGTDHASIATEAKVVAMLRERGIKKGDLSREKFLEYAWEWKEKYGGIILSQLRKLGASCDWERTSFTMDPAMSEAVTDTFIHLFEKGLVYRAHRMVNWDPLGKTTVSDEEVVRKETNQKLVYIRYRIGGRQDLSSQDYLTIATVRPETIMADAAICVNPKDERYQHLIGKTAVIPLIDREIPIIADEYVEMDFGTGCLKVTPAHDPNDYELGQKHRLQTIDILNEDGSLNAAAQILVGEDRFSARKKIIPMLEEAGALERTEDYRSQVGYSERTDAVIEPRLSLQWFVNMQEMAKPALEYVLKGDVNLIPEKFVNTYRHWMENVKDWCISRQLWWGQRIPVWYTPDGEFYVAKTAPEAFEKYTTKKLENREPQQYGLADFTQDEDVVDTWFSSWLWPMTVFDPTIMADPSKPGNADLQYYYPTNDLVTAPEILFFWVARMVMAGHEFRGEAPFKNVYLTGIVRDKLGRKMSKSLGNSPDPLELIGKYGADGVRVGMLLSSPAGNDIMFDEAHCEQGRNFANKIWNAFRLIKGWEVSEEKTERNRLAMDWFGNRFAEALAEINTHFAGYRLSDALMSTYKLVWDDYCAWYLEMIKPPYGEPIDRHTRDITLDFFSYILRILHPFMPFITEELWHDEIFGERHEKDCCIVAHIPVAEEPDNVLLTQMSNVQKIISEIRNIRNTKKISPKEPLGLYTSEDAVGRYVVVAPLIMKLAGLSAFSATKVLPQNTVKFIADQETFVIGLPHTLDTAEEKERLEKELDYLQGFLQSVDKKLQNTRFVENAKPEVVENERKKKRDAEIRIEAIKKSLDELG